MQVKYDIEERLIAFAVSMIKLAEQLPRTVAGINLMNQLTRSSTSPALNYAEAQAAESRADFIHKMKIALKELRETHCCLKIIDRLQWLKIKIDNHLKECNELVSIFVTSIQTTKSRQATK